MLAENLGLNLFISAGWLISLISALNLPFQSACTH